MLLLWYPSHVAYLCRKWLVLFKSSREQLSKMRLIGLLYIPKIDGDACTENFRLLCYIFKNVKGIQVYISHFINHKIIS